MPKLKILCLHGYRQNADFFREKTGGLRKLFKKQATFDFVSAPHIPTVPADSDSSEDSNRGQPRGWWFSKLDNQFSSKDVTDLDVGFDDSVAKVVRFAAEMGPYDGILAFSQGAAFAVLLAGLRARKEIELDFSFMILIAGFPSLSSRHAELMRTHLSNIYCLHVYGENDEVVDFHNSQKLVSMFDSDKCEVIIHKGGHFVPPLHTHKEVVKNFIEKMCRLASSKSTEIASEELVS